jgi:type I restriction enzyme S subunit
MNSKFKIQNSTFPRYDRYKDSGVEWLGEIPEHWEPFRAKHVFRNVSEKGFPDEPLLSATQDRGVVPRDQLEQRVVMPVGQLQTFKLVREDNFVISLSSFQGVIEHCAYQGLVSPAYTVLRLQRDVNPRFLRHLLRASNFISELNISVTGIRQGKNIDYGDFAESILPIPPKPEQDRIVTFLDRKTAEIDALIAKKQRQIELLDEQKAILINRAVTRGLNPNAKLKPSGIEWIGDIPEHWEVKPGLAYFQETDVRSTTGDEELLSVSHITGVTPRSEKNITMFMAESYEGSKICEVGDIAVNTMWAWMAALGVSKYRGLISPSYNTYCQKKPENYHPEFLDLLLRSNPYKGHYFVNSSGITTSRLRLYPHPFLRLKFLRPPLEEQEQIVEHCSQVSGLVKKSADTVTAQIGSLKTLRSTLIAHAVTGRIKV